MILCLLAPRCELGHTLAPKFHGSVEVTDLVGDGGTDHLMGIERLVFADDVIDL